MWDDCAGAGDEQGGRFSLFTVGVVTEGLPRVDRGRRLCRREGGRELSRVDRGMRLCRKEQSVVQNDFVPAFCKNSSEIDGRDFGILQGVSACGSV